MTKLKITEIDIKNKKILIRVDFNVPLQSDGSISDTTRIKESIPTIRYALNQGASIILLSHMGRPQGKKDPTYSLSVCAKALSDILGQNVKMAPDCIGMQTAALAKELKPQEVLLLENLRFYPAEENPDLDLSFAKQLANMGQLFVNDAFATAHRKHSSTVEITKYFPTCSVAGLLMEKEIEALSYLLKKPTRPFFAIIGGAKISTKIGVLHKLAQRADEIFIGGAMTYTLMLAKGYEIGSSIADKESIQIAEAFINLCKDRSIPLHLPEDLVIATKNQTQKDVVDIEKGIPLGWEGVDIGPKTRLQWKRLLEKGKTVFWNGPLGVFESPPFDEGTLAVAKCLSSLTDAITIIGGGDSVAAINQMHLDKHFTHLSTGGGASLEYIEFGSLPGVEALSNKKMESFPDLQ